jgi:hypothetical protein
MATINCVTGVVTGTLRENASFDWINPNTSGGNCLVSDVGGWCTASSYSVPQASSPTSPGSISATTKDLTGTFSFMCPCLNSPSTPRITIGSK